MILPLLVYECWLIEKDSDGKWNSGMAERRGTFTVPLAWPLLSSEGLGKELHARLSWPGKSRPSIVLSLVPPLSCHSIGSVTGSQWPRCHGQTGRLGTISTGKPVWENAVALASITSIIFTGTFRVKALRLNPLFCSHNLGLVAVHGGFHRVAWGQERGRGIDWPSFAEQ